MTHPQFIAGMREAAQIADAEMKSGALGFYSVRAIISEADRLASTVQAEPDEAEVERVARAMDNAVPRFGERKAVARARAAIQAMRAEIK